MKVEKRKERDSNFEEFYFTHVEDALNKLIDTSKSKVGYNDKQDSDLKAKTVDRQEDTPSKSVVSLNDLKGSILKRWKFI